MTLRQQTMMRVESGDGGWWMVAEMWEWMWTGGRNGFDEMGEAGEMESEGAARPDSVSRLSTEAVHPTTDWA